VDAVGRTADFNKIDPEDLAMIPFIECWCTALSCADSDVLIDFGRKCAPSFAVLVHCEYEFVLAGSKRNKELKAGLPSLFPRS